MFIGFCSILLIVPKQPIIHDICIKLFIISLLCLFFELAFIRYVPGSIRFVAYYNNIVLISSFLGLGLGCLHRPRKDTFYSFPWCVLVLVITIMVFKLGLVRPFSLVPIDYNIYSSSSYGIIPMEVVVPIVFALNAVVFYVMGQKLGHYLERVAPLEGYSINILGNLAGIIAFIILTNLRTSPLLWFGAGFILSMYFLRVSKRVILSSLVIFALTLFIVYSHTQNDIWSPYYKISRYSNNLPRGMTFIQVDDDFYQAMGDLSSHSIDEFRKYSQQSNAYKMMYALAVNAKKIYELPFQFIAPRNILILGAGTGNDTASALRFHPDKVDAVDIDPVIIDIGKRDHPERPYSSVRVHVCVDDARSFVKESRSTYDLIMYGFLDSHRMLSHMASIRLENYVYTVESFQESRNLLDPNGILSVAFSPPQQWVAERIFAAMAEVFGHNVRAFRLSEPTVLNLQHLNVIIAGPGIEDHHGVPAGFREVTHEYRKSAVPASLIPNDNWPFLYLKDRKIPSEYLLVMAIILIISTASLRVIISRPQNIHLHFFFLGAGFLLYETKSITECALLFGSTWKTTSVVLFAFLSTILLSNIAAGRQWIQKKPLNLIYAFLLLSILVNYLVPLEAFVRQSYVFRLISTGVFIGTPIFFAGIIFALTFKNARHPSSALGSNLLGCIVGGLGEYACLIFGLKSLYIIASLFYVCSFVIKNKYKY